MKSLIDTPRAILRGEFMTAAALVEHQGIPIDMSTFSLLLENWERLQDELIKKVDVDFDVYQGRTFKTKKFVDYLKRHEIRWPVLPSGSPALDDDTFKDMATVYPQLIPLRELRSTLSRMRLKELSIGADGRNRCMLSAFKSATGRNQPSNANYIFGPAVWLRSLIKPKVGYGLAYVDYSQQEFGIAAALSKDTRMQEAYLSGDPYLAFAKQAGAVPANATKESHKPAREKFKRCVLGMQYMMTAKGLASRIGCSTSAAQELIDLHRSTYRIFWAWNTRALNHAMLYNEIHTVFGWTLHVSRQTKSRTLQNFPMQANGAETLRHACCETLRRGVRVCALVHDALLIEAPLDDLGKAVEETQLAMAEASACVLGGFKLRSEAELICFPDRFMDPRGKEMWEKVSAVLVELGATT
jgi:DNA polymerase-1